MNRYVLAVISAVVSAVLLLAGLVAGSSAPAEVPSVTMTMSYIVPVIVTAPAAKTDPLQAFRMYIVRQGDYLSSIAIRLCNEASDWTGIFQANRSAIKNPNLIFPRMALKVVCIDPPLGGSSSVPKHSSSHGKIWGVTFGYPNYYGDGDGDGYDVSGPSRSHSVHAATAVIPQQQSQNVNPGNYSGFQACVISRESGGNSQVMNSTGHYGLYQFSESTWIAYGGSASTFGHASVSEQNQVFANAMSHPGGASNWSPYDGC